MHGIIWDVDGTLLDSAAHHFAAWQRLAADIGQPFTEADFSATFGKRNPEIVRQLFDPNASDEMVADIGRRKEDYYRAMVRSEGVALLPGVAELLDGFAALGYPQAVGSSAPRGNLELLFAVTGVLKYFAAVVGQEDTTRGKPDPQVFLVAAERIGVRPADCIVFEDAAAGVQAAKAAGMRCVAVVSGHHPVEELTHAGADRVVRSLTEVSFDNVMA